MRRTHTLLGILLFGMQLVAIMRIALRFVRTSRGHRIETADVTSEADRVGAAHGDVAGDRISVIVPVLNEEARLGPCLAGLSDQGRLVSEILVVDGGSRDRTREVVVAATRRDHRVRWVDASPVPDGVNGKAWGLQTALEHVDAASAWVLTIDADVRPTARLADSLVAHAAREGVPAFSVATPQRLSGRAEAFVHPSLLASMVLRYGIPGMAVDDPEAVQANGQCFLIRRQALVAVGGFASGVHSLVEDVTLGRELARQGITPVGFYEPRDPRALLAVEMYGSGREAWMNWSRSLPMRDASSGAGWWLRMTEMSVAMGLPLPILSALAAKPGWRAGRTGRGVWLASLTLEIMRGGLLAGMRRAYLSAPWTYWLSPLVDPVVVATLWAQAVRRNHAWRGRAIRRGI